MKRFLTLIVPAVCLLLAGTASASQIAQFTEVNQTNDFVFDDLGTSVSFDASSLIFFTFAPGLGTPYDGTPREATLTFTSTSSTAGTSVAGNDTEGGFSGSFSIIDMLSGLNLLSATFGPSGAASGTDAGNTATFQDSTPPGTEVVFTSDFLNFSGTTTEAFAISLSNVLPSITLDSNGFINSATGVGTGTFSAQPLPTSTTPEPATTAMIGGGLVGLSLLLRRRAV